MRLDDCPILVYSCSFYLNFFQYLGEGEGLDIFENLGGDTKINSKIPQNQNRPKWNSDNGNHACEFPKSGNPVRMVRISTKTWPN